MRLDTEDDDYDFLFKLVLVGDSGVGKSNLFTRFTTGAFAPDTRATIGVDFATRSMEIEGKIIKAQIWDTAGVERYRALTSAYYRGAHGCMIVYDVTYPESFANVTTWLDHIRKHAPPDTGLITMIVGNKTDLAHKRRVSTAEARVYCESKGLALIETSALDDSNVDLAFEQLLEAIFQAAQRSGFKRGSAAFEKAAPGQGVKVVLPSAGDAEQDSQQRARTQSRCCA